MPKFTQIWIHKNEIVMYQSDEAIKMEVGMKNELSKDAVVKNYLTTIVVANFATTTADGKVSHIGASLQYLADKSFAFSQLNMPAVAIVGSLK